VFVLFVEFVLVLFPVLFVVAFVLFPVLFVVVFAADVVQFMLELILLTMLKMFEGEGTMVAKSASLVVSGVIQSF
jgi:hypothetical protein